MRSRLFLAIAAAATSVPLIASAQTAPATPAAPAPTMAPPAGASCTVQSTDKKLAGAAQKSFMTKCQKDATTACNAQASEKKLKGAAKTSFTKKCVTDAVGA